MAATIDLRRSWLSRFHGDLAEILTWINGERAMVLLPWRRNGAPWYVVMEGAAWTWNDQDRAMIPGIVAKSAQACDVLGMTPTPTNCRRVASIIIDGLPDLIEMPGAPPPELGDAVGSVELRADGKLLAGQDVRPEKMGIGYA